MCYKVFCKGVLDHLNNVHLLESLSECRMWGELHRGFQCYSACRQSTLKGDLDDVFHFHLGLLNSFIIDYCSCMFTVDSSEVT